MDSDLVKFESAVPPVQAVSPDRIPEDQTSRPAGSSLGTITLTVLLGCGLGVVLMNPELVRFEAGPQRPSPNYERVSRPDSSFRTTVGPFDEAFEEMAKTRRGKFFIKAARFLKQ